MPENMDELLLAMAERGNGEGNQREGWIEVADRENLENHGEEEASEDEAGPEERSSPRPAQRKADEVVMESKPWSQRNLLPDSGVWVSRHGLELHVKVIKLILIVTLTTLITREISCVMPGWSCVKKYGPSEYLKFYWAEQCCDLLIIFFVSRMCGRSGADTPLFILMCLLGALFPSAQEALPFLRVSLSLYAINCQWQALTWVWVVAEMGIIVFILAKLLREAWETKALLSWVIEACAICTVLIAPNISDTAMHFHNWFFAWILAMLTRFDPAWSVATQAFFIGYYLNGIAIYGRHPVLACKEVFFLSDQQGCFDGKNITNGTQPIGPPIYNPPNPWNCSGDYARRSFDSTAPSNPLDRWDRF